MKYRPEIDGLRALAVVPVILFHAGIEFFSGGFIGVDVFFVISGYLITTILVEDIEKKRFSILKFYARRSKRILPLLLLVVVSTVAYSFHLMLFEDLKLLASSSLYVALFASNYFFWKNTGYFDLGSDLQPLLHTWSLAVEEQFYLLFPILLILLFRCANSNIRVIQAILYFILLMSIVLAEWASEYAPTANFYFSITRAWELLAGSLLAFYHIYSKRNCSTKQYAFGSGVGLIILLASYMLFHEGVTHHPGLVTVLPVIGVLLIILDKGADSYTNKVLRWRPITFAGLLSYGLYLWHFPIFSLATYQYGYLTSFTKVFLLLVVFFISCCTWYFVETPIRRAQSPDKKVIIVSVFFIITLAIGSIIIPALKENILSEGQQEIIKMQHQPIAENDCWLNSTTEDGEKLPLSCIHESRKVFLWGDSHAKALSFGMLEEFGEISMISSNACAPILDQRFYNVKNCESINNFALSNIKKTKPSLIFINAYWFNYNEQKLNNLEKTLAKIHSASPNSKVYVIGTVPLWNPSLSSILQRKNMRLTESMVLAPPFMQRQIQLDIKLESRVRKTSATYISAINAFCDNSNCLILSKDRVGNQYLMTNDYGHLNPVGAVYLAKKIKSIVESM